MNVEKLRKFVDFAWEMILDMPCGDDALPEDWERDEDGNIVVVNKAFAELEEVEKAEPIKYAHWIEAEDYPFASVYTCSECGRDITICGSESLKDYPYCHCGCKMDEVNEDEK